MNEIFQLFENPIYDLEVVSIYEAENHSFLRHQIHNKHFISKKQIS